MPVVGAEEKASFGADGDRGPDFVVDLEAIDQLAIEPIDEHAILAASDVDPIGRLRDRRRAKNRARRLGALPEILASTWIERWRRACSTCSS